MSPSDILKFPSQQFSLTAVKHAAEKIAPYAHKTPVVTCQTIDRMAGHQVFFKCENLQKTGAFKYRGAINALACLSPEQLKRGVVTHSSGNHAQALSAAARIFGTTAYIVMPSTAPIVKKNAVLEYGGKITECEPNLAARLSASEAVMEKTGATMIPPFNHPDIIGGQGTCALEFLRQVPNLDMIIVPVGGGGLLAGTCIAAKAISSRIKIIAGEPTGADDAFRSKEAGEMLPQSNPNTIADGLLTSLGTLTWPYVRDHQVSQVVTVTDEEIIAAMKLLMERAKLIVEPSAAVALAALLSPKMSDWPADKNVGIILSGGNVDMAHLPF